MAGLSSQEIEKKARALLASSGIVLLGWFKTEEGRAALLLGNIGGSLWPAFSTSGFPNDGVPDPMNRWTQNICDQVAAELKAEVRYPFAKPVWPFQRYAMAATGMQPSPLGILIHPEYGLWVALRAAMVFEEPIEISLPPERQRPCNNCKDKPCLSTCPVSAFSTNGYAVDQCRAHLASGDGSACLDGGCLARRACPVGRIYAYESGQQRFHMAVLA
ncbi:MAG: ferredoxin [Rhizobiaceae bacterium]